MTDTDNDKRLDEVLERAYDKFWESVIADTPEFRGRPIPGYMNALRDKMRSAIRTYATFVSLGNEK